MLVDTLRQHALQSAKAKDSVATTIFRLALGEVQTLEARLGRAPADEEAVEVVKKLVKSNRETLTATSDEATRETLSREIELLSALLPQTLDVDGIVAALAPVADAIKNAAADGPATGMAMKHLKSAGLAVEGQNVTAAVKRLRGSAA